VNIHAQGAGALPFFLKSPRGERFCLYHQPNPALAPRGTILYVHPFAEELNKSRRMAALQSRAFAQAGFGVLQIDLYGCGDSSGDFANSRWDLWLGDLQLAWDWLRRRCHGDFYVWGLRLGGLLALDFARRHDVADLILWQMAISGRAHLNQFTRVHSAARMFGVPVDGALDCAGTPAQAQLEVAGYTLASQLSAAINSADAALLTPCCPVQWLELVTPPIRPVDPVPPPALRAASALLVQRWRDAGALVNTFAIEGQPFWSSAEITESPALIDATLAAMLAAVSRERP
jgi:exosortase A-associated hydrolase 2